AGVLLVSTPNKEYYAEVRAQAGPNPFHCHEFEYAEFREALGRVFPHVRMWSQNHADAMVFAPARAESRVLEAGGDGDLRNAHFFVAACSLAPLPEPEIFAWIPSTSNVLRERERHIAKLEGELARKDEWLEELKSAHSTLHEAHNAALAEIQERTLWVRRQDARIAELEAQVAEWVGSLKRDLESAHAEIERLRERERELQATVVERTEWAWALESELAACRHELKARAEEVALAKGQLALVAQSKWVRLGRSLNVGPAVPPEGAGE
ncbi:MAG: hypothetical protein KGN84_22485, partial [Acidobacteriota bacterium]|nr:hypothetical protein [Acidobacteriota bacterium]